MARSTLTEMMEEERELREQVLDGAEEHGMHELAFVMRQPSSGLQLWAEALAADLETAGVDAEAAAGLAGCAIAVGCLAYRVQQMEDALMESASNALVPDLGDDSH